MKRENYDLEDRLIEFAVQAIDIAEALPRNLFIFACPKTNQKGHKRSELACADRNRNAEFTPMPPFAQTTIV